MRWEIRCSRSSGIGVHVEPESLFTFAGIRSWATDDPRGFLDRFKEQVVIDEAQHVPDLFSYIQGIVDHTGRPGQFVLTGSQNFLLLRRISQSLGGRCDVLHLLPFSRAELTREALQPIMSAESRRRDPLILAFSRWEKGFNLLSQCRSGQALT